MPDPVEFAGGVRLPNSRLTVLGKDEARSGRGRGAWWRCRCECGEECSAPAYALRNNSKRSCGCLAGRPRRPRPEPPPEADGRGSPREAAYRRLYELGLSRSEIARRAGVSYQSVSAWAERHGLPWERPSRTRLVALDAATAATLDALAASAGKSVGEVIAQMARERDGGRAWLSTPSSGSASPH